MEKKNSVLGVLVILLSIVVLGLTAFIVYDKVLNKDAINNAGSSEKSIKINKDKDYVYDANYKYNNEYTEFKRDWGYVSVEDSKKTINFYGIPVDYTEGMQYLSNLKVPYININSEGASTANKKIEKLYMDYAQSFDGCATDKAVGCTQILTYRTYKYNNLLSVVVIDSTQGTAPWVLNYTTFVLDLNSGKLLKYNEVLEELSLDNEKTSASIKNLLMSKMKELWGEHVADLSSACYNDNKNCYEKAYMTFEDSINNNTLNFFVNDNGNLSLLLVPYYDGAQNGDRNKYLIELK